MQELLITFETAKLAKEKGFTLQTNPFGYVTKFYRPSTKTLLSYGRTGRSKLNTLIYAPTQSLLQRWLREVHGIHIQIIYERGFWMYSLYKLPSEKDKQFAASGECQDGDLWLDADHLNKEDWYMQEYKSYEEALEHGLQEALKLIELASRNKNSIKY